MEEVKHEKIYYFLYKYSKLIIAFFLMLFIFIIVNIFKESYSTRLDPDAFSEIQRRMAIIYASDMNIFNNTKVREVEGIAKGIDISSWQKEIDWDKVAATGIDYVMIRCGFSSLSTGKIQEDTYFRRNIEEANRLGIPVGIYFYSSAINEVEVLEEASYVLKVIKDFKITYPIAYDFETFTKNRAEGINNEIINHNALTFLQYIEKHGYKGMLYTNYNNIKYHWNLELFTNYPIWYAQYIDKSTYEGEYSMWQYADNGYVDGIIGNVDLNESYIIYESIN